MSAVAGLALSVVGAAQAQDFSAGLVTDYETGGAGVVLQYDFAPHWTNGTTSVSYGGALRLDQDGDSWIGAGVVVDHALSDAFFVEFSFMPGYYEPGDTVLGGNLHFRSLLGIGLDVGNDSALILSIDHLSNGNLHDFNPGAEAVALRYRMGF